MAKLKRGPGDEPENDDPAGMPDELKFFDPDDWPLPPLVEAECDRALLLAKSRRAWRTARADWLAKHEYADLARTEGRTRSREYSGALRRAHIWKG